MKRLSACLCALFWCAGVACGFVTAYDRYPPPFTAAKPYCWLVLANGNSPESVQWAIVYTQTYHIPPENIFWLRTTTEEHIASVDQANAEIFSPVKNYLQRNPELKERIVGIVVGYDVPGTFGRLPYVNSIGDVGGYSVANTLQNLSSLTRGYNFDCSYFAGGLPAERLTRETLGDDRYFVGRIDAPTLDLAIQMTQRAMAVEGTLPLADGDHIFFDYSDPALPNDVWYWLQYAVCDESLQNVPWTPFEADSEATHDAAFRFGSHDIDGWQDHRLYESTGSKILAFNFNSFGACSVRDCNAPVYGNGTGPYVPNAISAGFAAAIGATGEPGTVFGPFPHVMLQALERGWTLGEAMYFANAEENWVWTLVGDPLLMLRASTNTPDDVCIPDANCDGTVDVYDIDAFVCALTSPAEYAAEYDCQIDACDANCDGEIDVFDIDAFILALASPNDYKAEYQCAADSVIIGTSLSKAEILVLMGLTSPDADDDDDDSFDRYPGQQCTSSFN